MNRVKIAFIDGAIDIDFIRKFKNQYQEIGGIFFVYNNMVLPKVKANHNSNILSHATSCVKMFLESSSSSCLLYFIEILETHTNRANIDSLISALTWCNVHDMQLINLSIGTISFVDAPKLVKIVDLLTKKGIIVVSANSNDYKMTFPASFEDILSVKCVKTTVKGEGFTYLNDSIDRVNITCYMNDYSFKYKNKFYFLEASNSFATAIMSAKICDFMNNGYITLENVKSALMSYSAQSMKSSLDQHIINDEVPIEIPIIVILTDLNIRYSFSLILKLLDDFLKHGFSGVCLSTENETNMELKNLNFHEFPQLNYTQKLHFYSHYCNVDYLVLTCSKDFALRNIDAKDIDLIVSISHNAEQFLVTHDLEYACLNDSFIEAISINELFCEIYKQISE